MIKFKLNWKIKILLIYILSIHQIQILIKRNWLQRRFIFYWNNEKIENFEFFLHKIFYEENSPPNYLNDPEECEASFQLIINESLREGRIITLSIRIVLTLFNNYY